MMNQMLAKFDGMQPDKTVDKSSEATIGRTGGFRQHSMAWRFVSCCVHAHRIDIAANRSAVVRVAIADSSACAAR